MGEAEMINLNLLIDMLKSIRIDQASTDYNNLFYVMNLVELAIAVPHELFAKNVDLFMKVHATLLSISSQIKDAGGLYTAGTVVCISVL